MKRSIDNLPSSYPSFQLVVAKSASARHEVREGRYRPVADVGKLERQRSRSELIAEAAAVQEHATDLWNEELEQSREILENFLETPDKSRSGRAC